MQWLQREVSREVELPVALQAPPIKDAIVRLHVLLEKPLPHVQVGLQLALRVRAL